MTKSFFATATVIVLAVIAFGFLFSESNTDAKTMPSYSVSNNHSNVEISYPETNPMAPRTIKWTGEKKANKIEIFALNETGEFKSLGVRDFVSGWSLLTTNRYFKLLAGNEYLTPEIQVTY